MNMVSQLKVSDFGLLPDDHVPIYGALTPLMRRGALP